MRSSPLVACSLLALVAASCGHRHRSPTLVEPTSRQVYIEVEAYDPVSGLVWQGVDVRIVEAWMERTGLVLENPDLSYWYATDDFGTALFTSLDLGDADVGFRIDGFGRAFLEPFVGEDEAIVTIELSAIGSPSVFVDVAVSWDDNDVFVSVPFVL